MAAEAELNALKKLEANKACVNCDAYNKFGHGNVCEKFKTFVCSNCKSAHQSFSMRVKSVTMSNWTKEEVDALKEENGGGNAVAKRVWLGKWDESKLRKPQDSDHVDVYKRFIDKVYNDRAFYDEDALTASPSKKSSGSGGSSRNVTKAATSSSSNGGANLLDFSSPTASSTAPTFDAFASPPKSGQDAWGAFASAPAPTSAPTPAANGFDDGFGAFMAAPAAPVNPMASFDPFAASSASSSSSSSTAFASTPAAFDPFGPTSISAAPQPTPAFNAFGGGMPQQVPAPMARPPSSNFGAFDALSAPPPTMGMGMGMGMGGGMGMGMGAPRPGMMHGGSGNNLGGMGMNMGMGMGMPPQQGMMMGGGGPRPMMGGGGTFMGQAPPQANAYGARPGQMGGGSRDPFAGLGLPGK